MFYVLKQKTMKIFDFFSSQQNHFTNFRSQAFFQLSYVTQGNHLHINMPYIFLCCFFRFEKKLSAIAELN